MDQYSMSNVISISGSSGVGKTTLAKFIQLVLGSDEVVHLCGDDLHRWQRGDSNWDSYTHLDPSANNLEKGYADLLSMRKGESIKRKRYNHLTGTFDPEKHIESKHHIVNEGLHALLDNFSDMTDISIFVETSEDLKRQWKISRDTQKRGYTTSQVENVLKRRELDEIKWITPQKENADAVVWFDEKNKTVQMKYEAYTKESEVLLKKVKKFYDLHRNFLVLCRKVSLEYDLVQHGGGNVSYKIDDKIVITSSGINMGEVGLFDGFSLCSNKGKLFTESNPSMELEMHLKIPYDVVLHTHPIYLNIILCAENSQKIISEILHEYDYDYISYHTPGKALGKKITGKKNIILLENHGLVCSGLSFLEIFNQSTAINNLCKQWLIDHSLNFKVFFHDFKEHNNKYLFPDAAIVSKTESINNYMIHIQQEVGLVSRFLAVSEIDKLKNMKEEKYRMSVL